MMYESQIRDIKMVIKEQVELEFQELKGDGTPQFLIVKIDGEEVEPEDVLLVDLKCTVSYMSSRSYIPIDFSNYHGLLEVFYCKKKKGMFKKETLKAVSSVRKPYHKDALENGTEKPVSIKEIMKM